MLIDNFPLKKSYKFFVKKDCFSSCFLKKNELKIRWLLKLFHGIHLPIQKSAYGKKQGTLSQAGTPVNIGFRLELFIDD